MNIIKENKGIITFYKIFKINMQLTLQCTSSTNLNKILDI